MLSIGRQKFAPQVSLRDQAGLSHFRSEGCWSGSVITFTLSLETVLEYQGEKSKEKVTFSSTNGQELLRMDVNEPQSVGIRSVGLFLKLTS